MVEGSEKTRRSIALRATRLLRTDPTFREYVSFVAPDGTRPVIVTLLDDTIGDVFDRIRRSYRDGANVLVGAPEGKFTNIVVTKNRDDDAVDVDGLDVHVDCSIGMFMAFLLVHRGETVRCNPVGDYAAELQLAGV